MFIQSLGRHDPVFSSHLAVDAEKQDLVAQRDNPVLHILRVRPQIEELVP